ncbi:MAG: restriction endonuclease [Olivibacter sp.]|nr:restriction endonuclease [Olivibacter sp. UJ_SKK_5.1]
MDELINNILDHTKVIILLWLVLVWLLILRTRKKNKHQYNRLKSKEILEKIRSFPHDGQRIAYLRKIDPFVFEELLLDAFKSKGFKVERNKRYTGDHGIDGVVWIDGKKYLIQAKRYKRHINLKHIKVFAKLVEAHRCNGLFCHCGKTGKGSKEILKTASNIEIISGQKLTKLITEQRAS